MSDADARVHCEECEQWIDVTAEEGRTRCQCGTMYMVTVSRISAPRGRSTSP